jgi:3-dehydroquinate synthase
LHEGWLRHGIAEIIKMAVVKDVKLFELLEDVGPRLIYTKFGTLCPEDEEFCQKCDLIVGMAMHSYVQSEYGNLWETHQCRPHAYGHTWSPGYELPAGMLHGHAVGTCMGYGALLAKRCGFISLEQLNRILRLISTFELSLWHPIMDDPQRIWDTNVKIIQKRGGHLCAPVPRDAIGQCGYIQDLTFEEVGASIQEYHELCQGFPRGGLGVEVHCREVGLEDPSVPVEPAKDQHSLLKEENAKLRAALHQANKQLLVCGCEICEPPPEVCTPCP